MTKENILDIARQVIVESDFPGGQDTLQDLLDLQEEHHRWEREAYRSSLILLAYCPATALVILGAILRGALPLLCWAWLIQICIAAGVMFQQCRSLQRSLWASRLVPPTSRVFPLP